jgi:hypothetical protein
MGVVTEICKTMQLIATRSMAGVVTPLRTEMLKHLICMTGSQARLHVWPRQLLWKIWEAVVALRLHNVVLAKGIATVTPIVLVI